LEDKDRALEEEDTKLQTELDAHQVEIDDRLHLDRSYKRLIGTSWSLSKEFDWTGSAYYKKGLTFNEDMTFTLKGSMTGNVSLRNDDLFHLNLSYF